MHIYGENIVTLSKYAILAALLWGGMCFLFYQKRWFQVLSGVLGVAALYVVLQYTVIGRTAGEEHLFTFAADYTNEFFREMFMNALLYFPLGLSLSVFLGPWAIAAACVLSVSVETWQYLACTGLAQGTDVIMNTLGAAIGAVPFLIAKRIRKRR